MLSNLVIFGENNFEIKIKRHTSDSTSLVVHSCAEAQSLSSIVLTEALQAMGNQAYTAAAAVTLWKGLGQKRLKIPLYVI